MQTLKVDLADRSYPIHIGHGLLCQPELLRPHLSSGKVLVVSNTTVAPLYLAVFRNSLEKLGLDVGEVVLPDGETYKNWETLNLIFDGLLQHHCERKSTLVALGGGVVGDMGGFAAACYQRGMPFIQVPTTLLAQVDSSVGGKTAINHPLGKNMIGAFCQPGLVLADIATLATLDDRQYSAGIAEIIKMALIRDHALFLWLETHIDALLKRDQDAQIHAVESACANKAAVVAADEFERGERALLNLGHTFGHAIEAGLGYGVWLHGEAVAAGMMMAAELSKDKGWLEEMDLQRIEHLLQRAGLPVNGPRGLSASRYLELMRHDKKVEAGRLRLVLLRAIGEAVLEEGDEDSGIIAAMERRIEE